MRVIRLRSRKGKHCRVVRYSEDKVLKVFTKEVENFDHLEDFRWGDLPRKGTNNPNMSVPLVDATKIQNYAWLEGLAPRVFEIVGIIDGKARYFAQIIEDAGDDFAKTRDDYFPVYKKVKDLGKVYGFKNEKNDSSARDVIGGKLIDFNTFHFSADHDQKIQDLYRELGTYGKKVYHPEFDLSGPRQNDNRVGWMKLDSIDFEGKSVSDFGCAGGFFCRYSKDRGASDIVGYDHPGHGSKDPVKGAYIASIENNYMDIDFENLDLPDKPDRSADIVFYLSMNFHIGVVEWLPDVTKEVCIFEDNSKNRDALPILEKLFRRVERVGTAEDHGDKPLYHCWK